LPGILERDFFKAYLGIKAAFKNDSSRKGRIVSVPWGTGAFGGDIRVKLLLLWLAVSLAAAEVRSERNDFDDGELVFIVKTGKMDERENDWNTSLPKIAEDFTADMLWKALKSIRDQGYARSRSRILSAIAHFFDS